VAGLGVVVAIIGGNPSPRPTLGAQTPRVIKTPLSNYPNSVVKADVVITMANGATYTVSVHHPVVDVQHQQEMHSVMNMGSPVSSALGAVTIDMRIQGYITDQSTIYEEPAIPQIPKFASPEDAQAWLDKNSA
jgi:hypothetical protein